MILLAIALSIHPQVSFPQHPTEGQVFITAGDEYRWHQGKWEFKPQDTGMLDCPNGQHLHPKKMSEFMPDTKGGPLPVADGKCHFDDRNDSVAPSRGSQKVLQKRSDK